MMTLVLVGVFYSNYLLRSCKYNIDDQFHLLQMVLGHHVHCQLDWMCCHLEKQVWLFSKLQVSVYNHVFLCT